MMKSLPLFLLALLAGHSLLVAQQPSITGQLLGHDGTPMPKATVYLFAPPSLTPLASVEAGPDGRFALAGDHTGMLRLKFTGANHREFSIPLILERARTVKIDVRLGVSPPILQYDQQGRELPPTGGADSLAVVTWPDPSADRAIAILARIEERQRILDAASAGRRQRKDFTSVTYDWSQEMAGLAGSIARERDPLVRQVLLFSYIMLGRQQAVGLDPKLAKRALDEIPATSPLWQYKPGVVNTAMSLIPYSEKYEKRRWAIATGHPDARVRELVLYSGLEAMNGSTEHSEIARRYYQELVTNYPESDLAEQSMRVLKIDKKIKAGFLVPDFSFPSIDDSTVMISNASMKGKVYLIDFWGTWCGPCIAEMENLHAAYEKFRGRNFEILSIALENDPYPVMEFRKRKWKMPWMNAVVTTAESHMATKLLFEVPGVPYMILVDGNGTILATDDALHGPELAVTVEYFLGHSAGQ